MTKMEMIIVGAFGVVLCGVLTATGIGVDWPAIASAGLVWAACKMTCIVEDFRN